MNARRRAAALLEVLGVYLAGQLVTGQLILSLLLAALGSGVVFAWTRSLLPSVLAHAISNVPMTPFWQGVIVTALIIGQWSPRGAARPRSGRSSRAPVRLGASNSLWWERAGRSPRRESNIWTTRQQAWSYWP
jgi:hypothetical protein